MKSDKLVKWLFIAVVFCIVMFAVAPFLVDADTRKESQEKAAKSTEKLRLK